MRALQSLVAAFAISAAAGSARGQQQYVVLLDYRGTVPTGWQSRQPSSNSRLAEYTLAPTNAGTGEVVVYFFGPQQGPNVEANLARWQGQFSHTDGSPVVGTVSRDTTGMFPTVFAEYDGTYRRGIGAGTADSIRTGQRLIAAIVPTPKGTMFIQMFGSDVRIAAERSAFQAFVRGLKPAIIK